MRFWGIILVAVFACRATPVSTPAPTKTKTITPPAVQKQAAPDKMIERVKAITLKGKAKQQCNDLTGCPMMDELIALGPSACNALYSVYQASKSDKFWRLRLIEALSRCGAAQVHEPLAAILLSDPHGKARVQAALALGRLRVKKQIPTLIKLADQLDPQREKDVLLAVGFALAQAGHKRGLEILEKQLVSPMDTLRWDLYRPGIYAAGKLKLTQLRPVVEDMAVRANPFVRREAVIALRRMRDPAAIPVLIGRLKDALPGVRAEAQKALEALTGLRHRHGYEQWQRWRQQNHR
jgi:HEAT repeat protein